MVKRKEINKGYFITGTDTEVGKTVATYVLGLLYQSKGLDVGIMKPIQCAGSDAKLLKKLLNVKDSIEDINPFYAKEPLSPHIAFSRSKRKVSIKKILNSYKKLAAKHEMLLVEGAGGLLVPIKKGYLMADLIRELELEVIIVSRLGLGTINHTMLTIQQARNLGLKIRGVIFNEGKNKSIGISEKTNPKTIKDIEKVPILGTIPFLKELEPVKNLEECRRKIHIPKVGKASNSYGQKLKEWDKNYLWHPFTQMKDWLAEEPLVIDRAEGSFLIDSEGNRYLDGVSSLWVNVHGHKNKDIDEALKKQINRLSHSTLLGLSNTPSIELARELVSIAPKGLEKVFYSDSGSTAVEIAIKIAYQYWQNIGKKKKSKIVHLENAYHGDTLGSVSVGGIDLFHKVYDKLIIKTVEIEFPDCYRAPRGKAYPQYAFEQIEKLENLFKKKASSIAAFIVEPIVQGAAGMIMWPKGILEKMAFICKKYDVFLIVDEVATGFGRTGKMFATQHENVNPDILCLAKGITAGYLPLAATLTTKRIFDGFNYEYKDKKTFFHGHTYSGNPLCCAAALANLKIFKQEKTLEKLQPKIKSLEKRLKMFYNLRHVGDVRQRGFMVGIELVRDKATKEPFAFEEKIGMKVSQMARKYGVILRPLGNVIVLMPPLSISIKELDMLIDATYRSIQDVLY